MECRFCRKEFSIRKCYYDNGKGHYCTNNCCTNGNKGIKHSKESIIRHRQATLKQFKDGMPEKTKNKLSKSLTGNILSIKTRHKIGNSINILRKDKDYVKRQKDAMNKDEVKEKCAAPHINRKHSKAEKEKRSNSLKLHYIEHPETKEKIKHCGKDNGMWQDGKSFEPYTSEFDERLKDEIRKRDNYQCQIDNCGIYQYELNGFHRKLDVHHIDYDKYNLDVINLISLCKSCHGKTNTNREYWTNYFVKSNCK